MTKPNYSQLNYLKLNRRSQKAMKPLEEKMDAARGNCYQNPKPYIDYDEDRPPTKEQAFNLCNGCELLVECGRFAAASKPYMGVWAGEVYAEGKRLHE